MKKITLLGSTGSIGKNTLEIARHLGPEKVQVTAIAAHSNIDLLESQAKEFNPELIAVYDKTKALELQKRLPNMKVVGGMEGLQEAASHPHANFVMSAIAGTLGLAPTVAAIKAGKKIGLANKEALVSGGALVMSLAKEKNVQIIPVDSEHSALFQCLNSENPKSILRLILTASGGPFRTFSNEQLMEVTVDHALRHPNWAMGPKVTIDCSTLMNKGLEAIEAHWLFNIPMDKIEVVIHPQSIIHSMIEFIDNSIMAQMCEPTMIVPIQYAMTHPERLPGSLPRFDFKKRDTLQFLEPDHDKFRCLNLAFHAAKVGGSMACYMNAANEILVNRFMNRQISWLDISTKLSKLMDKHQTIKINSLDDVMAIDHLARHEADTI